jgi:branched-chain amino acid transport system permease protein
MVQVLIDGLAIGSLYGLFTLGLSLEWGVVNILNLAYASIFVASAYISYLVAEHVTTLLVVILPTAMLAGALISILIDVLVFRRLRKQGGSASDRETSMMVASIGLAAILATIVEQKTGGSAVNFPPSVLEVHVYFLSGLIHVSNLQIVLLVMTIAIGIALALLIRHSRMGRALRAVASDPATCELFGINSNAIFASTMAVGGALAGAAGVLLMLDLDELTYNLGDPLLLSSFAIIVIGGVGSIKGALIGGFVLGCAESALVAYGPGQWQEAIAFALIIIVLIIKPTGFFSAQIADRL